MIPKFHCFFILLIISINFYSTTYSQNKKINLILDTDIGPDYDDVGAIAVMYALADSGYVNILSTISSNQSKYVAASLNVLNTYFKHPDIPIGIVKGRSVNLSAWQKWDSLLVSKYPHSLKDNTHAKDALKLYRSILSSQPDKSVTIVTIGFLTNLADLWLSKPDEFSSLSGKELIEKKVKSLICMAGQFPSGKEWNVDRDPVSSKIVFDNWNTPIVFSGWEIGEQISTGLPLTENTLIRNSPIKDVFSHSIPLAKEDAKGRKSWDQTAVLIAIKGSENYYNLVEGRFLCMDDGSNKWDSNSKGHFYVTPKMKPALVEKYINQLMMYQPPK